MCIFYFLILIFCISCSRCIVIVLIIAIIDWNHNEELSICNNILVAPMYRERVSNVYFRTKSWPNAKRSTHTILDLFRNKNKYHTNKNVHHLQKTHLLFSMHLGRNHGSHKKSIWEFSRTENRTKKNTSTVPHAERNNRTNTKHTRNKKISLGTCTANVFG